MTRTVKQTAKIAALIAFLTGMATGCGQPTTPTEGKSETSAVEAPTATAAHKHDVAGETCFICDASKRDPKRLWCKEHSRYEDRCFLCHPELQDKSRLYCTEHSLYEDECFLCHPELLKPTDAQTDSETKSDASANPAPEAKVILDTTPNIAAVSDLPPALFCKEHHVAESECGICHPELLTSLEVGQGLKVRLSSNGSARKAGVRTGYPNDTPVVSGSKTLGQVTYNKTAFAAITPLASGVVRQVYVDAGATVEKGQLLAEISSPAIADAKNALVTALVDLELKRQANEREKGLVDRNISPRQDYEATRAAFAAAESELDRTRQQLLNLGLTDEETAAVEKTRSTSSVLPIVAPFSGTITDRQAVSGIAVDAGTTLFQLADLSTMWLDLAVPESDAGRLTMGTKVVAEFDALPGETFEGELSWIASEIDAASRTVQARVVLPNPDKRLKSGLFGRATVAETAGPATLTVPTDAVQMVDGRSVVFAKLDNDLYETRVVRLGATLGGQRIVLAGLNLSDEIVVAESYIVKSEFLKARLGAGCVDE